MLCRFKKHESGRKYSEEASVRGQNQERQRWLEECGENFCACRERGREQLKVGEQRGKYEWMLTEAHPQQPQVSLGEKGRFKLEKLITACRMKKKVHILEYSCDKSRGISPIYGGNCFANSSVNFSFTLTKDDSIIA